MAGKSTTASLLSVLTGVVTVSLSAVHTGASGENALQDVVDGIAPNINSSSQELQRVASRSSFSTGQLSDFTSDPPVVTSVHAELAFNSSVRPDVEVPEECVVLQFSDFVPWDNPDNLISHEVEEAFDMFVGVSLVLFLYLIRYFML